MKQGEILKMRRGFICCIEANQTHLCPPNCPYTDKTIAGIPTYCEGVLMVEARGYIIELERQLRQMEEGTSARLLMPSDWKENPDLDVTGELPAWVEWSSATKKDICFEGSDGWACMCIDEYIDLVEWGGRAWNKRPTKEQMETTPWE